LPSSAPLPPMLMWPHECRAPRDSRSPSCSRRGSATACRCAAERLDREPRSSSDADRPPSVVAGRDDARHVRAVAVVVVRGRAGLHAVDAAARVEVGVGEIDPAGDDRDRAIGRLVRKGRTGARCWSSPSAAARGGARVAEVVLRRRDAVQARQHRLNECCCSREAALDRQRTAVPVSGGSDSAAHDVTPPGGPAGG
jgi:hypothetical protein